MVFPIIFRAVQTYLLETGKLSADTINILFDSICQSHNIYAKSSIGITSGFYKRINLLSRDTTNINFKTGIYNQGEYEDINYYAYMEITPYTYLRLIPIPVLVIPIGIFILYLIIVCIRACFKTKTHDIINLQKNGNYKTSKFEIDIQNRQIRTAKGAICELTQQQKIILSMFLNESNHCIKKEKLKNELWSNSINKTNNMTTAIIRLKEILEKTISYTIETDIHDKSYYILKRKRNSDS